MLAHYGWVGSIVVGVLRVNSIKGRVVTKAMLGYLSGNPNVLDHSFEATVSEETISRQLWSFRQEGDL